MPKFSGLFLSWAGVVIGSILLILGITFAFGFAYSLILSGVFLLTGSLLFVDTDEEICRKENRK
ncbi:hypothetical protein Aph01nite_59330 [Acrocarpospora phusangensis]|uniref:Uncharacterized protein n=1 Tax=Acrocarpospora phusangensis TaxID=1070424 RepID=A0A919QF59_9ACTN|nr:hypothetical protein Aph01nite_59330 [Acrocarpospora phusangensis]